VTNIQVRDVPAGVHAVLAERAARAGQSLQQYLVRELTVLAGRPTLDEVIERLERRQRASTLTTRDAVDALEAERAGR